MGDFARNSAHSKWWSRISWIGACIIAVMIVYPVSSGPLFYFVGREWIPWELHTAIYRPLSPGRTPNALGRFYLDYIFWWHDRGRKDAQRPDVVIDGTPLWNAGTRQHPKWVTHPP